MRGSRGILAAILGIGAVLSASSSTAADDPMLALFKSACFATHADPKMALAVVDAAGWRAEPVSPDQAKLGIVMHDKWIGKVHWELMVNRKDLPPGDVSFPTVSELTVR